VPSNPPHSSGSNIDFYFTGIEPNVGGSIIQPVLQWNQSQNHKWTMQPWAVWPGGSATGPMMEVLVGDLIQGMMYYSSGKWNVVMFSPWGTVSLQTNIIGTQNLATFATLEGKNIEHDADVPGDCDFHNMSFKYNGNNVPIQWQPWIAPGFPLSGLRVDIYGSSRVVLNTAN